MKIFRWLVLALLLAAPAAALAQGIEIKNPLACDEAVQCVQRLLNGLVVLAIPVASIMILVGGFQIMFANGNEEKIKKARGTIIYAIVGFGIIVLSTGIVAVIEDFLSGAGS